MSHPLIRRCTIRDVPQIQRFLHEHWCADHVLSRSADLLCWQHGEPTSDHLTFLAAFAGGTSEMLGVIGMIPTRLHDPALADCNTIWLSTWQALSASGIAGLGLLLLRHAIESEPSLAWGTVGSTEETTPIYRSLRCQTGSLDHFFMPNDTVSDFAIASVPDEFSPDPVTPPSYPWVKLRRVTSEDVAALHGRLDLAERVNWCPVKSARFFLSRYLQHPFYDYMVHSVECRGRSVGLMASRLARTGRAEALRIVDLYVHPEVVPEIGGAVQELVQGTGAEYADVYCAGLARAVWAEAGFTRVGAHPNLIVPNYFEPFMRKNIVERFAIKTEEGRSFILFKADCDQDRPNQLDHGTA